MDAVELERRLKNLEIQQGIQTLTLRYIVEGRWTGELPTAAAEVVALMGGTPPPDFKPVSFVEGQ